MANMKTVALIDAEIRSARADVLKDMELLAKLVGEEIEPLLRRIEQLERDVQRLKDADFARSMG
jgi:hypothetical protein